MGVSPRQFPGNLKKQEGKMDQDRSYNKISTNEQQIKLNLLIRMWLHFA